MLDKVPIRTPPGAQLIACPPKQQARPAGPCALVIFGATGDLTKRLVVPALYNLSRSKALPEQFALIGVARSDGTAESWRERLHDMLKSFVGRAGAEFNTDHIDEDAWARLADAMMYISGDLTKPDLYDQVRAALDKAEKAHGTRGNAIFYLAVADRLFGTVVEQLGKAKLTDQGEDQNGGRRFWRRTSAVVSRLLSGGIGQEIRYGDRAEEERAGVKPPQPDVQPDRTPREVPQDKDIPEKEMPPIQLAPRRGIIGGCGRGAATGAAAPPRAAGHFNGMRTQYEAFASYGQLARARRANGTPRSLVNTNGRWAPALSQAPQRPEIGVDRGRAVLRPPHMQLFVGRSRRPVASILGTVCKRKTACKMGLSRT
jgi:hypothetical protein